jgi:hypothetical protein
MGEYIPIAGGNNSQLPGMGGVFNYVNLHVYHYAGNNPVVLTDPDGRSDNVNEHEIRIKYRDSLNPNIDAAERHLLELADTKLLESRLSYTDIGLAAWGPCYMRSLIAIAETYIGRNLTRAELINLVDILAGTCVDTKSTFTASDGNEYITYYVSNSEKVISETLKILDPNNSYSVKVRRPGDSDYEEVKKNAAGSLISVPGHWQEGSRFGTFRWDPYHRLNNSRYFNKKDENATRYVSIDRIKK